MHRKVFVSLLFLCLAWFTLRAAEPAKIHLPVRVFKGNVPLTGLTEDDFKLFVNGIQHEILSLAGREKSIGRQPNLKRYFILSFHINEYSEQIEKGLAFFISDILSPADILLILSPVRIYELNASVNKEQMIREITGKLQDDYYLYNKRRLTEEKKLSDSIRELKRTLKSTHVFPDPYMSTVDFLNYFPGEYAKYANSFLLPAAGKFGQVVKLLDEKGGQGERWWLHFQDRDINTLRPQVADIIDEINTFISLRQQFAGGGRSRALKLQFTQLKKKILFAGSFPVDRILDTLIGGNICYNIVFLTGIKKIDAYAVDTKAADTKKVLEEISLRSGGTVIKAAKFEQGVVEIKDHVDRYYDLLFSSAGETGAAKVKVMLAEKKKGKGVILVHKDTLQKEVQQALTGNLTTADVKITGFSQEEHIIKFSLRSYKLNKKNRQIFGLLAVGIEVLDSQGLKVFKSEKTLRASKEELDISLTLPQKIKGECTLYITVSDLIANRTVSFERSITLK